MKLFSSILLLSVMFLWAFMPQLSAKHHTRTSFSFNFDVGPRTRYVERSYVYAAPVPVVQPYYAERVYYPTPYYPSVVVERPYAPRAYVQPYSYWGY